MAPGQDGVYLDYNAASPLRPEARAAVTAALTETGNASSVHGFGRAARQRVERARDRVAALVGAAPAEIVFTGSGTEANNLALAGAHGAILVSAGEHDSVLAAAPDATAIPLTNRGLVDLGRLAELLGRATAPALVSVMLANNETGVIQPLAEVIALAGTHGARVHCDAVQAAGKLPLDFAGLGVDLLSLSAHKLGGPQGVGALVVRDGYSLAPLLRGGGQERRRRAGTENVAGISGFGAAAEAARSNLDAMARIGDLRDSLESRIRTLCPTARVFGTEAPRLPNTSCLSMPGVPSGTQVMALDLAGVAVGAGSACSSGKVQASHVLRAMGVPDGEAESAIRVSLGWASRASDIDAFVAAWRALYSRRPAYRDPASSAA